ncbi:MAG TPA: hypothetical protein VNB95_04585 [Nitrososphaera sp.]|nr:hypothetical protein [Nitrososphaera sp.]
MNLLLGVMIGVMIILQHERRGGCCWTIPFIDSTASSRFIGIGIATTEKVGAQILTHNFIRIHPPPLFSSIFLDRGGLAILIH